MATITVSMIAGCGPQEGATLVQPPAPEPTATEAPREEASQSGNQATSEDRTPETRPPVPAPEVSATSAPFLRPELTELFSEQPDDLATYRRAVSFHSVGNARESLPLFLSLMPEREGRQEEVLWLLQVDALTQVNSLEAATRRLSEHSARWAESDFAGYRRLIEARIQRRRGLLLKQQGSEQAAVHAHYERALQLLESLATDPFAAAPALYLRGTLQSALGRRAEARETLERLASEHPGAHQSPHALRSAARLAAQLGDAASAEELLRDHRERYPDSNAAREVRSQLRELEHWGEQAPDVQVERWITQGELPGAGASKAHLLVFFATWCPRCQVEAAAVERLSRRYRERGLQVLGLTQHTRGQDDEVLRSFIEEHGLTHPIAVERGGTHSAFSVRRLPTAVWINESGEMSWRGAPSELLPEVAERFLPRAP